jgi:gentisate 1,2-dioxygenase
MASQVESSSAPSLSNDFRDGKDAPIVEGDSVERLLHELTETNIKPLWAEMAKYNPPLPNPKSVPFVWRYDEVRPYLIRAGKLVSEKQAERRVLMLVNPAMSMRHSCREYQVDIPES